MTGPPKNIPIKHRTSEGMTGCLGQQDFEQVGSPITIDVPSIWYSMCFFHFPRKKRGLYGSQMVYLDDQFTS